MSLGARATKGGAKTGKEGKPQDKGKTEKAQPKEKVKPQATTEQLRMAHMIDRKSDDASDVRRMVLELMEMTCRTEEEVCSALHDSDNDMVAACNLLLEDNHTIQGEWQTSEKKKKKPPAAGNGEAEPPREERSRSGPRPGRGEGEGGRGRGRGRGAARGAARGGRGGRRPAPHRPRQQRRAWGDQTGGTGGDNFPTTEDWDNEEWSGSLSDTKVFTPSSSVQPVPEPDPAGSVQEDWDTPSVATNGPSEPPLTSYTYHGATPAPDLAHSHLSLMEQMSSANSHVHSEAPPLDSYRTTPHHQPMGMSGSLSAAQSQYLSQLTAAAAAREAHYPPAPPAPTPAAPAPAAPYYGEPRKQRARVPPPSKIPMSAVEMPGGEGGLFLDVQFGAIEPELEPSVASPKQARPKQVTPQAEAQPVTSGHEVPTEAPASSYPNANSMLSESLSVVETTPASQPVTTESIVTNNTTSLEKQLSAGIKQLSVSGVSAGAVSGVSDTNAASAPPGPGLHYTQHHRPKQQPQQQQPQQPQQQPQQQSQQSVYHHAVSHHPPVYSPNVYAPQVNSTNASLTGASAMTAAAYPSSVTLTQYQPILNSYQQTSSSGTVYGGSALYTAAPYSPYQPPHNAKPAKDTVQYDSSVASSNSLTSTSTTQTSTAKVATTTVTATGNVGGVGATNASTGNAGYAGALYGAGTSATYAAYDEATMMRSTLPHHMGGYYEVGYGAREGTFGLGGGERFGRQDAASPQQVPAALPPGYAYFYQPPPTTYQYGVYPTYGGGSNVGGVGGVGGVTTGAGKLSTYAPQQPPYEQDSYKPGGPYTNTGSKSGGAGGADLTNAMYAKTHVALNKVNSYEKATFHSGTPPPFGAGSHLYIPAPPHHHPIHHSQHQMDARVNSSHNRRESGGAGGRAAAAKPPAAKPAYSQSYWAPN